LNSQSTIRLLMISDALDDAEFVTSMMRPAGYAVKAIRAEDRDELDQALAKGTIDVAMHSLAAMDLSLSDTIEAVRSHEQFVPVIAFGEDNDLTAGKALAMGAAERIQFNDQEQMRHVIVRELDRVRVRRQAHWLSTASRESEQRARALMESSRDAIAYIHDGMHVLANDAYLTLFGYNAFEEVEGMPMIDMVQAEDQTKLKEFLRNYSTSDQAVGTLDLALQQAEGNHFQAEVEFSRASIEGEACSQIIIRHQGNTEELEKQLNLLSQRDSVTGLFNRQHFMELLQGSLTRAEREEGESSLLELTLDDFSSVKDRVGILGSDQVIGDIAGVLQATFGEDDQAARLDGATFAVLTPISDQEALDELAGRVRGTIKDHICDVNGTSIGVTATIGIARIDGSTTDPNDILSRAERAWEEALKAGPDAHRIYQPKEGELSQKQIDQQWVDRIRELLRNEHLQLLYEPIVGLTGESIPRYEVVFRVLNDDGHAVEDPELLAAAERTGMSKGLDRWTVLNALKALIEQLKVDENSVFFVPLSGHAFDDPGLFKWIHDRVSQINLPDGALVFQVDAGAAANRIKQAGAFAKAVHTIGCRVCLSGFGHGADPFQVTRHVSVDCLRVNDEFTHNLQQNDQNQQAIREIASRASEEGKQTICPGVKDAGSLSVLWGLGTDIIQGEFLQEPGTERDYDFSSMAM
jgi:diguanylate cyclase (GGDEF)-like protein/PAS domain S-box-containing protein